MPVESPPLKSFAYDAQTADGQPLRGTLEASSPDDVRTRLAALNLRVMNIAPAEATVARGRPLNADDFEVFNQQLAHLTQAGLPVETGLRLIAIDLRSGKLAAAAKEVAADLEAGTPLEQAFAKHANRFPPLYGKLVEAGAKSGNLAGMLFNLGKHLELVGRLRQSLWRTVSYPLMVLFALALVLLFVSIYVLPQFDVMYQSMYQNFRSVREPPWPTQLIMALGRFYPYALAVIGGVTAIILGGDVIARALGVRGIPWTLLFLRIPLLGNIIKSSLLARWIDALRLGIEAGLDMPRAIRLATDATDFRGPLVADSNRLIQVLEQGLPLGEFRGSFIPATIPVAIELAAHTRDLPSTLRTISRMCEQQAEQRLRLLPGVLTPIMMFVVGGGIGFCVAALFLPFTQMLRMITSSGGEF